MCEQYLQSVVEPHLAGKLFLQCIEAQNTAATYPGTCKPDFFLQVFVKAQIYMTPVRNLADLQEIIYAAVNNVTPPMLHNTWVEVEYRLNLFRVTNGSHVEVYGKKEEQIPVFTLCSNWFHLQVRSLTGIGKIFLSKKEKQGGRKGRQKKKKKKKVSQFHKLREYNTLVI